MRLPSSVVFLTLLLTASCGGNEAGVQSASEIIRKVSSEIRTAHRVQVSVKASAEEPTAEDLEVRRNIENRIEQANIGRLVSSGAGAGETWVVVEVDNTAEAIPRLQEILRSMDLARQSSFKVIPKED